ncbi:NACHT domain-containing protein [Streptomyces sp. CAU 1734]|uniref:NACHT domain-containing protein n=1 Tax=Streptomyces sp. CAU 1734 TaxID=3140360 RepID=UPI00325FF8BC
MDVTTAFAARLAAGALAPLVRKLFTPGNPGAALVSRPVRIAGLVAFRGEKQTLTERDLRKLAGELVARAAASCGPHEAPAEETRAELTDALTRALHSLGDLEMDDVQAVRLGPAAFARTLARPERLSAAAEAFHEPLLLAASLHILNFFTQRSSFVPHTLVEQTRSLDRLIEIGDLLAERIPSQLAEDTRFERRYTDHIARKHGELTIHGLDLDQAREWRLDSAYVSLEATGDDGTEGDGTPVALPAERVLSGRTRVLLRGGAGSGKTTLVQWLAVTTARARYEEFGDHLTALVGRIPFVLPLRRVMRDGAPPTPDQFLHAVRSSVAAAQPAGWADRVLRAGRALMLVDGIDEIPRTEREEVRRWLRELMGDFPGNLWLVTARPSAVNGDWPATAGFTELTLSPMSRPDVTEFVRRWHTAAGASPELAGALLDAVRSSTDLSRLAVNPLMCGLLCALHRERRGFLPHGRRDLYEAALRMLLERRDTERGIATGRGGGGGDGEGLRLSSETQILLLQKLAHWLIRNDRAEMERSDALTQLSRSLAYMAHVRATPERVLTHLLERSGLLREPAPGRIDFVHRTFQDHLGAKALVEEGDFPLLLNNAHRDQWEDVIRMAVAMGRPAERSRILEGLIEGFDPETGRSLTPSATLRRLLLAASCLEQATEVDPGIRARILRFTAFFVPPETPEWARHLADLGGPLVLGLLPGPEGLPDDQAVHVVTTAARIGTDAALPLLARFRDHGSLRVRRQLAWSWRKFDTREYADEILSHLDQTGLYFTVRTVAELRALREMGGRARLQIVGDFTPDELVRNIAPDRLTHLWFTWSKPLPEGWGWLERFPALRTVVLPPVLASPGPGFPAHITLAEDPDGPPR